eukprot:g6249.t1
MQYKLLFGGFYSLHLYIGRITHVVYHLAVVVQCYSFNLCWRKSWRMYEQTGAKIICNNRNHYQINQSLTRVNRTLSDWMRSYQFHFPQLTLSSRTYHH